MLYELWGYEVRFGQDITYLNHCLVFSLSSNRLELELVCSFRVSWIYILVSFKLNTIQVLPHVVPKLCTIPFTFVLMLLMLNALHHLCKRIKWTAEVFHFASSGVKLYATIHEGRWVKDRKRSRAERSGAARMLLNKGALVTGSHQHIHSYWGVHVAQAGWIISIVRDNMRVSLKRGE